MDLLGIGMPDREPKATEYIPKMIKFIELLIEKGAAYVSGGDVYFNIKSAKDYGRLSNQNIEKMETHTRVSAGEQKKDPLDFALWKSAKEGEPAWKSPWGNGRPGWHIECSAMSSDILGDQFDIHGGGIDLIFPHHENEIAQSEGAGKPFARYWIHNGLLTIANEKMAKSLGNFISIKGFLAKHSDADYLKLLFLNTHYRHPVDYTEEKIAEMKAQKERIVILAEKLNRVDSSRLTVDRKKTMNDERRTMNEVVVFEKQFEDAMDDDFNMPQALAAIFDLVTETNRRLDAGDADFAEDAKILLARLAGVFGINPKAAAGTKGADDKKEIESMIEKRSAARKAKDFAESDRIRKALDAKGIILEDTKDGTVWRRKL
jgi:cysteinyl-tRNA synthetase